MKIFITGGGGFIGSSLILHLQNDYEIVCFGHGNNFTELKNMVNENVRFVDGDLADKDLLESEMNGMDIVIHLAGITGNVACLKDPLKAVLSHTIGTHNMIQASLKTGVRKFIFASTQSVYTTYTGRPIPFPETMSLVPDDFYGALKAAAENDVADSGINYVILRFTNVYGYGSGLYVRKDPGAMGRFVRTGLEGGDITIYGTGDQGIDYVHISDVCDAISQVIKSSNKEIFNVGSGKLTKIHELTETVSKLAGEITGKQVNIKSVEAPPGSIWPDRLMSIDKIRSTLGWQPSVTLEDGIKEIFMKLK